MLVKFEETHDNSKTLSSLLNQAIIQSKSSLFKLLDIRDWIALFDDNLTINNTKFNVFMAIQTVKDIMSYRANLMNMNISI